MTWNTTIGLVTTAADEIQTAYPWINQLRHKKLLLWSIEASPINEDADSKWLGCFYGLISLVIMVSASFSVTHLPVNDVLEKPEYWYEIIFSTMLSPFYLACATAFAIEDTWNGCINLEKDGRPTLGVFVGVILSLNN